jgi:tetratricopeptide (TPR) repeat protein
VRRRKEPQADIFKLVHDWLRDKKNGRWLVVVDNADDTSVLSARATDNPKSQADNGSRAGSSAEVLRHRLFNYLPPSKHGSVLVTSRTRQAAMQLVEDSDIIPVEPMDTTASHALLRKKLGDEANKEGMGRSIGELAAALDHIPLALVQAAAYIQRQAPRCSVQQYLKEFKQSDLSATSLLNLRAGQLRRDESASNAILITWQISFEHVRTVRKSAAELLSLMSFFDRQGIPEDLLYGYNGAVKDNNSFKDDLATLGDYSFVTVTKGINIFEMHSLVQLATRKWLESQDELFKWRERFISNLCAEFPSGDDENWERCQALFPHAKAAMTQRPESRKSLEEWALLLFNAGWHAHNRGRAHDAEDMSVLSRDVRSDVLGEESAETLNSMEMVGLVIRDLEGKSEDSEVMHRQILAKREKVLGREHPSTLKSMHNIGGDLFSQGRFQEAEAIFRQVLTTGRTVLGPEHPIMLATTSNLGLALLAQGKYKDGEAMFREELVISQKVQGHEHPTTLTIVSNLARALSYQGRWKEAEVIIREVLAKQEKVLGCEHPRTLISAHDLALALENQGMFKEAEAIYRQTMATEEGVLGHEHPVTLTSVISLAVLLADRGCYSESLALFDRACAGRAKVFGEDHPKTRSCYEDRSTVQKASARSIRDVSARTSQKLAMFKNRVTALLSRQKRRTA